MFPHPEECDRHDEAIRGPERPIRFWPRRSCARALPAADPAGARPAGLGRGPLRGDGAALRQLRPHRVERVRPPPPHRRHHRSPPAARRSPGCASASTSGRWQFGTLDEVSHLVALGRHHHRRAGHHQPAEPAAAGADQRHHRRRHHRPHPDERPALRLAADARTPPAPERRRCAAGPWCSVRATAARRPSPPCCATPTARTCRWRCSTTIRPSGTCASGACGSWGRRDDLAPGGSGLQRHRRSCWPCPAPTPSCSASCATWAPRPTSRSSCCPRSPSCSVARSVLGDIRPLNDADLLGRHVDRHRRRRHRRLPDRSARARHRRRWLDRQRAVPPDRPLRPRLARPGRSRRIRPPRPAAAPRRAEPCSTPAAWWSPTCGTPTA